MNELTSTLSGATPKPLTADQKAVLKRQLTEVAYASQTMLQALEKGDFLFEVAPACLSVSEFKLVDIAKTLGIETNGKAEMEERYAKLRKANERIRELESQIGAAAPAEQTKASLEHMSEVLNKWWDKHGFGHIADIKFTQYGHAEVLFSCHLFGAFRLVDSDTPISDKERKAQWLQSLVDRGFDVVDDEDSRDMELLDSDASRAVLMHLFKEHFPSSRVTEFVNHASRKSGIVMRDVKVFIYKLQDILDLDVAEQDEALSKD